MKNFLAWVACFLSCCVPFVHAEAARVLEAGKSFNVTLLNAFRTSLDGSSTPVLFSVAIPGENLQETRLLALASGQDGDCQIRFTVKNIQFRFKDRTRTIVPVSGEIRSHTGEPGIKALLQTDIDCKVAGCVPVKGCSVKEQALYKAGGEAHKLSNWYLRLFEDREGSLILSEDLEVPVTATTSD